MAEFTFRSYCVSVFYRLFRSPKTNESRLKKWKERVLASRKFQGGGDSKVKARLRQKIMAVISKRIVFILCLQQCEKLKMTAKSRPETPLFSHSHFRFGNFRPRAKHWLWLFWRQKNWTCQHTNNVWSSRLARESPYSFSLGISFHFCHAIHRERDPTTESWGRAGGLILQRLLPPRPPRPVKASSGLSRNWRATGSQLIWGRILL